MSTVQMIKKDAIINVQISSGFLQKLQQMLAALIAERTDEEIENLKQLMESKPQEITEEWMEHIVILVTLVNGIQNEAIKQGATYEVSPDQFNTTAG